MHGIYAIAHLTVLEALRSRLLMILALFVAVMLFGSHFIQYLTLGEQAKIFKDLSLGLLSLFTCVLAIVLPIEQLQREKERNSLAAVLVKPVHRYCFVLGKYLGICFVLALVSAAMTALVLAMMKWQGALFDANVPKASVMIFCQGLVLASCTILIGILFTSPILSMVCGISIYLMGNLLEPLHEWVEHAEGLVAKAVTLGILYLVPHLENLNMQDTVALGEAIPWTYVGENVVYGLSYSAAVFLLSAIAFNQKDF